MESESLNKTMLIRNLIDSNQTESWKTLGFYTDADLRDIPTHWLRSLESGFAYDVMAAIYTLFAIYGLIENLLVIYMIISCKSLRSPHNYLIANLGTANFLMLGKVPIFLINSIYRGPALGFWGCQISGFLGSFSNTLYILTLAAVAVDQAIVHQKLPSTRALITTGIWIFVGVFTLIFLFAIFGKFTYDGLLNTCSLNYLDTSPLNRVIIFVYFLPAYDFPLMVILYMYWHIWSASKEARKDSFWRNGKNGNKSYKKETVGFILTLSWFLVHTPNATAAFLEIFGFERYVTPLGIALAEIFCMIQTCIPFIFFDPKFQAEFKVKFPRLACSCWNENESSRAAVHV